MFPLSLAYPGSVSAASMFAPVPDLTQICRRQVEQVGKQYTPLATWIVYRNGLGEERHLSRYSTQGELNAEILSYLESEEWLTETLRPSLQLIPIPFADCSTFVYVYGLTAQSEGNEYWLLWTSRCLSEGEQAAFSQQGALLQDYMVAVSAIARQQQEIQHLEQLVQRGKHQLRDPLALIGLYAENLSLGLPEGSFREQALTIRETVNDLTLSLRKLLDCTPERRLHLAPYDLRKMFQELIRVFQPWLREKNITLVYPQKSLIVAVDRWQIKQVLENLLSNAIDFSPKDSVIEVQWQGNGQEASMTIRDQGQGLSSEDLEKVFTPFYSRRSGGTGLGLAIAKDILDQHQGNIIAKNHPNGGAIFEITLPRQGTEEIIGIVGEFYL
ncbi:HAMP domain-containing sensor histidine kinase [Spirulina sp. CS-785/01]|uniref:sensor histidine kinase n=1 Tax=Spirulina sp. CS-785/01 TaxID=3021716 RepID=UPI00232D2C82|nr:HAMP domain-containing sensor histidine kinase [Spirulina sp. CS-785/01]MDB9314579.1 HAMP domain-containing sensor histidine kinase [Spirulina sp. CS-785/01]